MNTIDKLKWQFNAAGKILAGPIIEGNIVLFGIWDKFLYAVDIDTGKERWRFETTGSEVKNIFTDNGVVFCSSLDSYLYAISLDTGIELWRFEAGWRIGSIPSIENGIVYVGAMDGYLYGINIKSGKLAWKYNCSASIKSTIISNNLLFYWSSGYILNGTLHSSGRDQNFLRILDVEKNKIIQEFRNDYLVKLSKLNDSVYFGTEETFYSFNSRQRKVEWTTPLKTVRCTPQFIDDKIYIASEDYICYLDITNGLKHIVLLTDDHPQFNLIFNNILLYISAGKVVENNLLEKVKINEYKSNYTFDLNIALSNNLLFYASGNVMFCKEY
jgi:outer membrane protein assembly factor BamB